MSTTSTARRMNSQDVLAFRETIPEDLPTLIATFKQKFPQCTASCGTMMHILELISSPPDAFLATPPTPIDVETTFKYSTGIFELLAAKVRELVLMMRNADTDQFHPLSFGSIENVGLSLFRRIFFIANEEAIRAHSGGRIVYPFLVVDPELKAIMRHLFLAMYFSPICDSLIPLYIYLAIPLCKNRRLVHFNVRYPLENIRHPNLDQQHLYEGVLNLKANNPPGSTPYQYEEATP